MLSVRQDIHIQNQEGIFQYFNNNTVTASDKKEITAHQQYEAGRALGQVNEVDLLDDIVMKSNFIKTFKARVSKLQLSGGEVILEMGGGWCWASILLKRMYPNSYVVGSDLVFTNLKRTAGYEQITNAYIDEKWVFNCRDIPFAPEQFDRIFTFAAFHHFGDGGDYSQSLKEMIRILKPSGKIILMYEPSSPKYLYKWAFERVNRDAYADEDVLILSHLEQIAKALNCRFFAEQDPLFLYREGVTQTVYYYALSKVNMLQKLLPSSVNIIIEKP